MQFLLHPLRFEFRALEAIHFPPGKSSNILRGAFGVVFRRLACRAQCADARECEWRATCPYARIFEPAALGVGPSGLADSPRLFVFRATHLDGVTVAAGDSFHFDLNLFDVNSSAISYLVLTFAQLATEGLGAGRKRVELTRVSQLNAQATPEVTLYEGVSLMQGNPTPLALSLQPTGVSVSRVLVRFVTPTELKSGQKIVQRPEFPVLAARIRDRISTLRELYDDGPLAIDFREFGERAALVRMVRCEIESVKVERRSSRTGQIHSIGGFIGEAEYEGSLAEFLPYLQAAHWTGVGRQTVWGKGQLAVKFIPVEGRRSD